MYTVKLADNTQLGNLELNGNNFISNTEITEDMFAGKLGTVEVTNHETGEVENYTDMELVQVTTVKGQYWFILREPSAQEKKFKELQSTIKSSASDITDIQVALAEVYELIMGGM